MELAQVDTFHGRRGKEKGGAVAGGEPRLNTGFFPLHGES